MINNFEFASLVNALKMHSADYWNTHAISEPIKKKKNTLLIRVILSNLFYMPFVFYSDILGAMWNSILEQN